MKSKVACGAVLASGALVFVMACGRAPDWALYPDSLDGGGPSATEDSIEAGREPDAAHAKNLDGSGADPVVADDAGDAGASSDSP